MSIELRPLGVKCNIACQYCYQHPQREVECNTKKYDMDIMKAAILKEGGNFTLFGGEALLVPIEDLEDLWAWGYEKFGKNSVQTNGSLITDAHVKLFKKYKVGVGVSIDGPGALNDIRWAGSLEKTRKMTQQTEDSIETLCKEGMAPAIIITLHYGNATKDKLQEMGEWIKRLDSLGVPSARLHLLEVESELIRKAYHLDTQQNVDALLYFHQLEKELKNLRFDIFDEIEKLQQANDKNVSCIWTACDPYTTAAVRGIEGFGQRSNCGRTNKDGIDFVKAPVPSHHRYIALYHTPQENGGCKGCRFFTMCKGQCPGTAIDGEWTNRTEHCEVWKILFELTEKKLEKRGKIPLSKHPVLPEFEKGLLYYWEQGKNVSLNWLLSQMN